MVSVRLRVPKWIFFAVSLFLLSGFRVVAQNDPDPNSPTPVLLSQEGSTRALAMVGSGNLNTKTFGSKSEEAFEPGSKVYIFASNLSFMDGEGANSLRVLVEGEKGRQYRFPVLSVRQKEPGIFAIAILLRDEIGFWEPPANGDVLIQLTWRGLASNQVKLGFGDTSGRGDLPGMMPTPFSSVKKSWSRSMLGKSSLSKEYVGYRWSGDRKRFQEQVAFGPNATLDNHIRRVGLRIWLAEQFAAQYPSVSNPYPNQPLKPANAPADCDGDQTVTPDVPATCFRDTYTMYPIQTWFHREAFYSDAQLRHRVSWALSQIWVTSGVDIQQSRHMVEYHKVLSANAFGNFRNLMQQMTLNPTMGEYLDMRQSTKNNPNENYAREIMQLFTIGLFMLNQDGTLQCVEHNPCEAGDTPVPTYDQNVVNNLTKVLTGWSFCNTAGPSCPNLTIGTVNFIDPMLLNTNNHDLTAKTLLSYSGSTTTNIPACPAPCTSVADRTTYANNSLNQAMENIFNHPNVGPVISKILIQHLVTSDPSPAYVGRVAAVFNNNGLGVRGDLKAVVKAILLDPEARGDVKTDPDYGKLREPVQFAMNILRHFNVRSANGTGLSDGYLNGRGEYTGMGQNPFRSPTVFNYYPPDNVIPGTTLFGPEFALMTTGTSIQRANFVNRFIFTAIPVGVSNPNSPNGTSLDFSDLEALSTADSTGNLLVEELNRRLMHSTMPASMKNTILTALTAYPTTQPLNRARQAIYLVATSSQYQVQR